jgi:hypothetical protein
MGTQDHQEERRTVAQLGTGRVSSKRLDRSDRTLSFFVLALQGSSVVVELRNMVFLRGTVYMADIHMKYV